MRAFCFGQFLADLGRFLADSWQILVDSAQGVNTLCILSDLNFPHPWNPQFLRANALASANLSEPNKEESVTSSSTRRDPPCEMSNCVSKQVLLNGAKYFKWGGFGP